jgi:hypothetical protein
MFDKAQEKIKSWWANPYWAPLTEPLRMIGRGAYAPNKGFVAAIRHGMDDSNYYGDKLDEPKFMRAFKEMWDTDSGLAACASSTMGSAVAGIAGGIAAGIGISMLGHGALVIGAGAVAATAASAVAFPFLVMGALAFAGASIAAIASPWGIGKGVVKAIKHHQFQKTQAAVVQATPALQSAGPDARENATKIYSMLRDLPADVQGPVLKSLSESFAATGNGAADRIMKSIEALPDAERTALVTQIRNDLAPVFEAVATAQAQESVTLQETATTMPALRFKNK